MVTPSSITFTPSASGYAIFTGSSESVFFGSANTIAGGSSSCTPGTVAPVAALKILASRRQNQTTTALAFMAN
jgi:hypothetical protein